MSKEVHFLGKVATKTIIVKDNMILMTRSNKDSAIWDLPGGRINIGENIETGLRREILEELGVDITVGALVYSEQLIHTGDCSPHLFITLKATLVDQNASFKVPSDELAEVIWVDQKALNNLKVYDNCARAISSYWKAVY